MAHSVPPAARQMNELVKRVAGVVSDLSDAGIVVSEISITQPKSAFIELIYSAPCDALGGVVQSQYRNPEGSYVRYCRIFHSNVFVVWSRKKGG